MSSFHSTFSQPSELIITFDDVSSFSINRGTNQVSMNGPLATGAGNVPVPNYFFHDTVGSQLVVKPNTNYTHTVTSVKVNATGFGDIDLINNELTVGLLTFQGATNQLYQITNNASAVTTSVIDLSSFADALADVNNEDGALIQFGFAPKFDPTNTFLVSLDTFFTL